MRTSGSPTWSRRLISDLENKVFPSPLKRRTDLPAAFSGSITISSRCSPRKAAPVLDQTTTRGFRVARRSIPHLNSMIDVPCLAGPAGKVAANSGVHAGPPRLHPFSATRQFSKLSNCSLNGIPTEGGLGFSSTVISSKDRRPNPPWPVILKRKRTPSRPSKPLRSKV